MTTLGRYLRDTGTSQAWLAECVGVSKSTVNYWAQGRYNMSERHRRRLLAVLRDRAALSLDGLCADLVDTRSREAGGTPFDQLLRAA